MGESVYIRPIMRKVANEFVLELPFAIAQDVVVQFDVESV